MEFVQSKVKNWVKCLSRAAEVQPQASHEAMIHSLQFESSFCHELTQIVALLWSHGLPLLRCSGKFCLRMLSLSDAEKSSFFLPVRRGRMELKDPVDLALDSFPTSYACSEEIIPVITGKSVLSMCSHLQRLYEVCSQFTAT